MAFSFTSPRGFEDRFRRSRSPRMSDPQTLTDPSNKRNSFFGNASNRSTMPNPAAAVNDSRNLQRRFTTSNYSSIAQQRRSAFDLPTGDIFAFQPTISPAEKKKLEYEQLRQNKIDREKHMDVLHKEQRRADLELARLQQELGIDVVSRQSEPSTPPEYQDAGFPNSLSRPNRFSAGNLISPPSNFNNSSKRDSQLASPPNERARAYNALTAAAPSGQHSKSNSDEEDSHEEIMDFSHRSAASFNRNSMPVTRRDLGGKEAPDSSNVLGHVNTHRFLFGDDDKAEHHSSTPRPKSFFLQSERDDFPVLLKRDMNGNMQYAAGSNALDLSSADESEPTSSQASKRSSLNVHRTFPAQGFSALNLNGSSTLHKSDSPPFNYQTGNHNPESLPSSKSNASNRHSLGANSSLSSTKRPGLLQSPPPSTMPDSGNSTPKLQSSYSTNDIPTIKNNGNSNNQYYNANATAQERLHTHNASLGRIPPGVNALNSKRQSREMSNNTELPSDDYGSNQQSISSMLQSPLGGYQPAPVSSSASTESPLTFGNPNQMSAMPFAQQAYPSNYGGANSLNMLGTAMGGLTMGMHQQWSPQQWNNSGHYGQQYPAYNNYQAYNANRAPDNQSSRPHTRRSTISDDGPRFSSFHLEDLQGQIYGLCIDQNGCRFLQRKLEENKAANSELIFNEIKEHMVDLMTDPFGNYLCQKLLEYTNKDQHSVLIENAAPHMVKIALNQHGTRALQKMIEYVVDEHQINTLINALRDQVVPMIQDLNGNHVIQKCLNRLAAPDIQFIIDSVSSHCIVVGTHRHGCCVIQRCIDHATAQQKEQLVDAITNCSLPLIQDPFGNYVLQYIFDQGETIFSQALCRTFIGRIAELSKQKFSSNVIEKCIRIAEPDVKHEMIQEIINSEDFERIADDPFANYVVQTAWDNADEEDEARLAAKIRPVLPRMRHKPYGRRFQTRINERDKQIADNSTPSVPSEVTSPEPSYVSTNIGSPGGGVSFYNPHDSGYGGGAFGFTSPNYGYAAMNPAPDFSRPPSHRMNNYNQGFSPFSQFGNVGQQYGGFGPGFGRQNGY